MKYKNKIMIVLFIIFMVMFLKRMNVFQVENGLGNPFSLCWLILLFSFVAIFIQTKIDCHYQKGHLNYNNLDRLKYICSILIIILHLRPFFHLSNTLDLAFNNMITRICVPIFFLITGYFVAQKEQENPHYIKDYIKKMIPVYMVWSLIYFPMIFQVLFSHMQMISDYLSMLSLPFYSFIPLFLICFPLLLFIALTYTGIYYHLWYFPATILSLLVVLKWKKHVSLKPLLILSFVLLLFGATETYYGVLPLSIQQLLSFYYHFFFTTRNFLFFGLFYIVFGYWLGSKKKLYAKYCFPKLIFSILLLIFEAIFLHDTDRLNSNILLSCVPLTYYLFICTLYLSKHRQGTFPFRNFSKYYYLLHPMIIVFVSMFSFTQTIDMAIYKILFVLLFTHITSYFLLKLKKSHPQWIL